MLKGKNIDDLFESGVFEKEPEPSQSSIHPILEHYHEVSTSTPLTFNVDSTGPPDEAETDDEEFVQRTCRCTKANGKPCSKLLSAENIWKIVLRPHCSSERS